MTRTVAPLVAVLASCALWAGCSGTQSVLAPAGPQAGAIARLWWFFCTVLSVIYVVVIAVTLVGVFRRRRAEPAADGAPMYGSPAAGAPVIARSDTSDSRIRSVIVALTGVTVLILIVFLFSTISTGRAIAALASRDDYVEIEVTGHQWWWEVEYKHAIPSKQVTTANEIHLPLNQRVLIRTASSDVIHSLWIPNLHGKRDLIPGRTSEMWLQADTPGVYRGQCAEFCGLEHAKMALLVVAEPQSTFNAWLDQQRQPGASPRTDLAAQGQQVFLSGPCALCHKVTGTPAGSRVGPDLTHFASRRTIAAGLAPNTPGYLGAWIADPQHLKPGARMPSMALDSEDVQALIAYLRTLK
jgi:cytochrome c oxidase subunit 2